MQTFRAAEKKFAEDVTYALGCLGPAFWNYVQGYEYKDAAVFERLQSCVQNGNEEEIAVASLVFVEEVIANPRSPQIKAQILELHLQN